MLTPSKVTLHRQSQVLELHYGEQQFALSAEFLRVHSPSAEVRGHGRGQEVLQYGKLGVSINAVEPQGNYGVRLVFDDGHGTGIYTWDYLHDLGENHAQYWQVYLDRLQQAGKPRDPTESVVKLINPS